MHGFDLLDIDAHDLRAAMALAEDRHRAALEKMNQTAADAAAHDLSVFRLDGAAAEQLHDRAIDSLADLHGDEDVMAELTARNAHDAGDMDADDASAHPLPATPVDVPEIGAALEGHDGEAVDPHGAHDAPDDLHDVAGHGGDSAGHGDDADDLFAGHPDDEDSEQQGDPHAELMEALAQLAAGADGGHGREISGDPHAPAHDNGHDGGDPVEPAHGGAAVAEAHPPADAAHAPAEAPSHDEDLRHEMTLADMDHHPADDLATTHPL